MSILKKAAEFLTSADLPWQTVRLVRTDGGKPLTLYAQGEAAEVAGQVRGFLESLGAGSACRIELERCRWIEMKMNDTSMGLD